MIAEFTNSPTRKAQNEAISSLVEKPRIVSYAFWSPQKPAGGRWMAAWIAAAASRLQPKPVQITRRAARKPHTSVSTSPMM